MLFECKDNHIIVDKRPLYEDFRINVNIVDKRLRLKLNYILDGENSIPMDLKLSFDVPKLSLPSSVYISLKGEELLHQIYFKCKITINLLTLKVCINGTLNGNLVQQEIDNVIDLLELIKSSINR